MKFLAIGFCIFAIATTGCRFNVTVDGPQKLKGSGVSKTEDRDIEDFHEIALYGAGTVEYSNRDVASLTITADDNLLGVIETVVEDGVLKIKPSEPISVKSNIIFELSSSKLERLVVDGAANVKLDDISGDSMNININGAGSVSGSGEVSSLDIMLKGAGSVSLGELKSANTKIEMAGAGSGVVYASESIDATVNGVGGIQVKGSPADVKKAVNGIGSIQIDE